MTERQQMGIKYEITDKVMTPVGSIQSRFTIDFLSKKKKGWRFLGNTQHHDLRFKQTMNVNTKMM